MTRDELLATARLRLGGMREEMATAILALVCDAEAAEAKLEALRDALRVEARSLDEMATELVADKGEAQAYRNVAQWIRSALAGPDESLSECTHCRELEAKLAEMEQERDAMVPSSPRRREGDEVRNATGTDREALPAGDQFRWRCGVCGTRWPAHNNDLGLDVSQCPHATCHAALRAAEAKLASMKESWRQSVKAREDLHAREKALRRALDELAALAGRLALGAAEIARRTSEAEADADNAAALAAGEETPRP